MCLGRVTGLSRLQAVLSVWHVVSKFSELVAHGLDISVGCQLKNDSIGIARYSHRHIVNRIHVMPNDLLPAFPLLQLGRGVSMSLLQVSKLGLCFAILFALLRECVLHFGKLAFSYPPAF